MEMLRMMITGQPRASDEQTRHNEQLHNAIMHMSARLDAHEDRMDQQEERRAARIHDLGRTIDAGITHARQTAEQNDAQAHNTKRQVDVLRSKLDALEAKQRRTPTGTTPGRGQNDLGLSQE